MPSLSADAVRGSESQKTNAGENALVATIQITPYIHVQGTIARTLPNGLIAIEHAGREYVGPPLRPVQSVSIASAQPCEV